MNGQAMKNWEHFQKNYLINQKGQSLVELASFGAVLLFCLGILIQYGMDANYQQNIQMSAFRRAMKAAYYKSGPAGSVSIAVTKDKPIPDPRDPWGLAERKSVSASGSVTWDSNTQAFYIDDFDEPTQKSDLPRSIIEVNDTLGLKKTDFSDAGIKTIDASKGAFTTADYEVADCNSSIMMVLENTSEQRGLLKKEYREVTVPCSNIIVKDRKSAQEERGKEYAYVKIDGLIHTVSSADIDHDGEAEAIIAVKGTQAECDADGYCGGVSKFKYVDFQKGEINSEYTSILPWEVDKANADIKAQQGLVSNVTITKRNDNKLVKTEDSTKISTVTTLSGEQVVTHKIRFNPQRIDKSGTPGGLPNDVNAQEYSTTFGPAFGPNRLSSPESVDAAGWRPAK